MKSPADRLIAKLEGGPYYKLTEVAEKLSCSVSTLRRLVDSPDLKAPSYETKTGQMKLYLYTEEDVEELRKHLNPQVTSRSK